MTNIGAPEVTSFWNAWIIGITFLVILGSLALTLWVRKTEKFKDQTTENTGHAADDIYELDNPLPRWWFWMFVILVIWGIGYIGYYGLANFKGISGWSSIGQYEEEMAEKEEQYQAYFAQFKDMPLEELLANNDAQRTAARLFSNNCAICHGSTGTGSLGFPNLTDDDWLYGGDFETIQESLRNGRSGLMAAWEHVIGEEGVTNVSHYVRSLRLNGDFSKDPTVDEAAAKAGEPIFKSTCVACHGQDGKGNYAFGAPNLTDDIWLFGGSQEHVEYTLRYGRNGKMPAWADILGEEKIRVLSSYVYNLSKQAQ